VTSNEAFFQKRFPAAVLKHEVLHRYSTVFATMAGTRTKRVLYLDGYAGPGKYDDGEGRDEPGSPLLLVESASTVQELGRVVDCMFIERRPQYAERLRAALRERAPASLNYRVRTGDVANHLDEALTWAGSTALKMWPVRSFWVDLIPQW
jgi:three-Cys-motif partner protein